MSAYLKVIGSGKDPIRGPYAEPYAEFTPTHPPDNISKGDFLVLYAAGWQVIFAVARVIARAPRGPDPQWPHRLEIKYIYNVPPNKGIHVNEISGERVLTRSVMQKTCISLRDAEFKAAWELLKVRDTEVNG
jgi:hypothetical protein